MSSCLLFILYYNSLFWFSNFKPSRYCFGLHAKTSVVFDNPSLLWIYTMLSRRIGMLTSTNVGCNNNNNTGSVFIFPPLFSSVSLDLFQILKKSVHLLCWSTSCKRFKKKSVSSSVDTTQENSIYVSVLGRSRKKVLLRIFSSVLPSCFHPMQEFLMDTFILQDVLLLFKF